MRHVRVIGRDKEPRMGFDEVDFRVSYGSDVLQHDHYVELFRDWVVPACSPALIEGSRARGRDLFRLSPLACRMGTALHPLSQLGGVCGQSRRSAEGDVPGCPSHCRAAPSTQRQQARHRACANVDDCGRTRSADARHSRSISGSRCARAISWPGTGRSSKAPWAGIPRLGHRHIKAAGDDLRPRSFRKTKTEISWRY
jgi:hypothetical protein